MKAVASSFDKDAKAKEKNRAISEQLSKQIENQQKLIATYAQKAKECAERNGENATSTQKWYQKMYEAEAKLNEMNHALDETNGKSSKFSEILKEMLKKEAIMAGLGAIKDGLEAIGKAALSFSKEVVTAYADFEQLEGGVNKLFGTDAMTVIKNAQNAFKTAGMSANEYMETVTNFSASLISSLGGDTAEAARMADRAIQDMSDNANTFGTDIKSIQNAYQGFAKQNYTMLDNLKLGYGGTKTEMERLILDAEKLNTSFTAQRDTNGNLALSFSDIVTAIGIVQDEMNITGTTAREASGTISGSIETMKSAFQNFVTGLGMSNADIDMLLGNVVQAFENVVKNVQPIIQRLVDYIPAVIAGVIPVLQGMAPDLMKTAVELFNGFVSAIVSVLPDLMPVAVDAVIMFANTIVQNLPTLIDAGIQFILALANGLAQALPDLVGQVPLIIGHLYSAIIRSLPQIIEAGVNLVAALIKGIISYAGNLPTEFYNILLSIKDVFAGGVDAAWGWGRDLIINFANGIIEHTKEVWSSVKSVAQSIWDLLHFSEPEKGPLKDFHTFAPDMMKTFAKGIRDNVGLVTGATEMAAEGISGALTVAPSAATAAGGVSNLSNAYNYGGITINAYQQPGEVTDEFVREIMFKMQKQIDNKRAVFG